MTDKELKLMEALDVAIEYIEAITGGDESATLDHLRKVFEEVAE